MEGVLGPRRRMAGAVRMALLVCAVLLTVVTTAGQARASVSPVVRWGGNNFCGLCDPPADLSGVVALSAAFSHSLALKSDGTVVAWGLNDGGSCDVPAGLTDVVAIQAVGDGATFAGSLAVKSDGTVVRWGVVWVPPDLTDMVAVTARLEPLMFMGLRADGTVLFPWGPPFPPAGLNGVIAIAARDLTYLALKSDGTVVAWGSAGAAPADLSGVVAIAAGYYHALALRSDGTVVAWGRNFLGQCDVPAGLTGVTAIAAGGDHSLALRSDGTVVAWGDNEVGQCDVPAEIQGHVQTIAAGDWINLALLAQYGLPAKTPARDGVSLTVGDFGYTFDQVSTAGETTVTASDTQQGGAAPPGFRFLGTYYDISTTATHTWPVTISIHYDPTGLSPGRQAQLKIFHWNETTSTWDRLDNTTVDTDNHVATVQTDSFSWFALGLPTYRFQGFLPPVAGANKPFKRGSTIPVKFRIADKDGMPVSDAVATLVVYYLVDGACAGEPEVVSTAAGDWGDQFRYDAAGDLYIFNLSTKDPSYLNYYTYRAVVTLDDGTTHSADFSLK